MSIKDSYTIEDLSSLTPRHETFVGIDSDGCVFDSMGVKQRDHFHPLIIKFWGLEKIEKPLREAAEFFNLYSKWRGQNRFVDLLEVFKALPDMPGVADSGVELPDDSVLEQYVNSGLPLGNPSLIKEVERTGDPALKHLLDWSLAVNESIDNQMREIPPFKWVVESLEAIQKHSDAIVVSQTPEEALVKEWRLHGIETYIEVIAGQELGKKREHLKLATEGKYGTGRVLMIGDAPGDRKAANAVGACFYPINPGKEEESWKRFVDESYPRFLANNYQGEYEDALIAEFDALLPEKFPWL